MKILRNTILLFLLCSMMLFIASCGILNSASEAQTYDFGNDSIPSITSVVGSRKANGVETGTSSGTQYRIFKYGSDDPVSDIQEYIDYLQDRGWLVTAIDSSSDSGTVQVGIDSLDSGKILLVTIDYKTSSYEVKAEKMEGTLTRY